jgi:hypothetical protein
MAAEFSGIQPVATFWVVRGPSGRALMCCAYQVATGLELRTEYDPDDVIGSECFRGIDADVRVVETAQAWLQTVLATGFQQIYSS